MFKGIYPALVTPFSKNGQIDYNALEEIIEFLIEKKVHGLFPLGTTGEALLLSIQERKEVGEFILKTVNNRIPVVFHVGTLITAETIELAKHAEKIGAQGVSIICPYFFPLNDREIYTHYESISKALSSNFPVFVYNFPNNARNIITPNLLYKMIENLPNIKALKYSHGDFQEIQKIAANTPEDFSIMLGPDDMVLAGLAIGTHGNVSGHANVFPEPFVRLYNNFQKGDIKAAQEELKLIQHISAVLQAGTNLSIIKKGLEFRGMNGGHVRAPLNDITDEEKEKLFSELMQIKY